MAPYELVALIIGCIVLALAATLLLRGARILAASAGDSTVAILMSPATEDMSLRSWRVGPLILAALGGTLLLGVEPLHAAVPLVVVIGMIGLCWIWPLARHNRAAAAPTHSSPGR